MKTLTLDEKQLRVLLHKTFQAGEKNAIGINGNSYRLPTFEEVEGAFEDDSWMYLPAFNLDDRDIAAMRLLGPHKAEQ